MNTALAAAAVAPTYCISTSFERCVLGSFFFLFFFFDFLSVLFCHQMTVSMSTTRTEYTPYRSGSSPRQKQQYQQCPSILRAPMSPPPPRRPTVPRPSPLQPVIATKEASFVDCCPAPLRNHQHPAAKQAARSLSSSWSSSEYDAHPEYPHLSPYSPSIVDEYATDEDEPRTPPAHGADNEEGNRRQVVVAEETIEHPEVLRPGGKSSGRLSGPLIAELIVF